LSELHEGTVLRAVRLQLMLLLYRSEEISFEDQIQERHEEHNDYYLVDCTFDIDIVVGDDRRQPNKYQCSDDDGKLENPSFIEQSVPVCKSAGENKRQVAPEVPRSDFIYRNTAEHHHSQNLDDMGCPCFGGDQQDPERNR